MTFLPHRMDFRLDRPFSSVKAAALQTRPAAGPIHSPTAAERDPMRAKRLSLQQRREIFLALVNTQDQNTMSVAESRQSIIKEYKITDVQLRQIEEEGSDKDWPPLNEAVTAAG